MDARFLEACGREFEHGILRCVEMLFENPRMIPGTGMAEAPVIGTRYIVSLDHSVLVPSILAALCARERFRRDAPGWAPDLPLREDEIEVLENDDDHRLNVLGMFGDSLRGESWNPQHPSFGTFVSGLLAYRHTPKHLRTDPELLQQFPPCRLKGMTGGWLTWRSREALAQHRRMKRMVAEHEARMGA